MPKFELRNIDAIKGKQKFEKLVIDNKCPFDEFENSIEDIYKNEIPAIYAYMQAVANLQTLPSTKFHFYDKKKGDFREFEFKSKHLRVYGITQPGGKIIITGGTKADQDKDQNTFRSIKNFYIGSLTKGGKDGKK